ncbi:type I DNA topoisomerase [Marivirga sp. S37H4]|uniref:DNA topoisomerase 1 n=1 Tax=Marivirga aurantiaca TaxID=2802615 RepID=A0A934WXG7_9BACT|nr:type I DNA topoisomerase [Marivirga aurantiaca]MBK6264711.1 type I DNA topoisomerase [Marivirga aurantiaca]
MSKNLVIVESPAKAKTIEGYLGKDYKVLSSYGHVRDLQKGNNAIDVKNGFTPTYEISKDKKELVKLLTKEAKLAEMIYLATDDDREGEAISWHLKEALKLDDTRIKRIVFREITKSAIQNALNSPRTIDDDLVNAQQARRILDRLVGFELSPILWKKIKTGLSAGRVQSVAVRIVVEREREIDKFKAQSFYKIQAVFEVEGGKTLKAELPGRFSTEKEAREFLEKCINADFSIGKLEKKPAKKTPAPPFTTSTLQQEASRKLGFSVSQTMSLAQRLYEAGKISYMRTDSLNLSDDAVKSATAEISSEYGNEFVQTRKFKTKSAGAQEAHEAIRPTNFSSKEAGSDYNEKRLYELIWKRAIASQMADAQIEKTNVSIDISTTNETLSASGEVIKFEGFLKVYIESVDEDDEQESEAKGMLPPLKLGQDLQLNKMTSREGFTRPPARYNEATLVKKLEELGIGRPSTYAPTISTVQKRGYVIKEFREGKERKYVELILEGKKIVRSENTEITGTEKNKLYPSNLAMVVNDFLVEHFPNVTDYNFTAKVEKEFDEIAKGLKQWNQMIEHFYGDFHAKVDEAESLERKDVNTGRELGIDPKTGKKVIVRLGKFGPLVQLGETPEEGDEEGEKPKFASLRKGQFIESITLEDALELFKLPRDIADYEDQKMVAAIGRFGPYIRHEGKFYSIPKEDDPLEINAERAIEIIEEKRKADREKFIKGFDEDAEMQILNGRWGPYIKAGKKNVKIPKDKEPESLTYAECVELAEKTPEKGKRGGAAKGAKAKADTTKTATKAKAKGAAKGGAKKAPAKKK